MVFDSLVDGEGNVYWRECGAPGSLGLECEVVSANRDGAVRWRVAVGVLHGDPILTEGRLVILTRGARLDGCEQALLRAFSTTDGAPLWSRDVLPLMGPQVFPNECPAFLGTTPSAGPRPGTVVLGADAYASWLPGTGTYARYMVFSIADGAPLEAAALKFSGAGTAASVILDEVANLYGDDIVRTRSLTPAAVLRWEIVRDSFVGFVKAAYGRALVLDGLDGLALLDSSTGTLVAQLPLAANPILTGGALTFLRREGRQALVRVDAATGREQWAHPLDPASERGIVGEERHFLAASSLVATSAGTILVVTQHGVETTLPATPLRRQLGFIIRRTYDRAVLREIDAAGDEIAAAVLEGDGAFGGILALRDGRLTGAYLSPAQEPALRSYPVPGRTVAPNGWVAWRGNLERNHHAR